MSVTNVIEEIMQLISEEAQLEYCFEDDPSWYFHSKWAVSKSDLEDLKKRSQTTAKEKGINSANVCVLLFLKYRVRIKYVKHMEN